MRRHLSGEPRSSTNSVRKVKNHPTYSSSQLSIKVSDLHADKNGRLEITCLSTIPAKVGGDDLFADFKSYSVKSKWRHLYSLIFQGLFAISEAARDYKNKFSGRFCLSPVRRRISWEGGEIRSQIFFIAFESKKSFAIKPRPFLIRLTLKTYKATKI
jgi:hypothetical protein